MSAETEPILIAVTNQKGGPGKSTTTMNTAASLARDHKVLVVDVDPQETTTDWADIAGDDLPFDFASSVTPAALAQLKTLDYDVILVDTPGSLENTGVLTAVLDLADFVILPLNPDYTNIKPLKKTVKDHVEPRQLAFRVLLNKVDMRNQGELEDWREVVDKVLKMPRFKQHIRMSKSIKDGPQEGKVVTQYTDTRANQNAIFDYTSYATELKGFLAEVRASRGVN